MKLSIKNRLLIGNLFPPKGNILEQRIVRDIKNKTEISQDEMKKHGIEAIPTGFKWNPESDTYTVDVTFTELEIKLLKTNVDRLDKEGNVTQGILALCEKINETK